MSNFFSKPALVVSCVALLVSLSGSQDAHAGEDIHATWNTLLHTYVSDGVVNYSGIKKSALKDLESYIEKMATTDPAMFSKSDQLAYYLNVYNANVIKGIVDLMPTRSVMRHKGFFKSPRVKIGGTAHAKKISLDDLEHKIVRPTFKDPRVHFALVCAARGCPSIPDHAFSGAKIDHCLEHLATQFFNSKKGAQVRGRSLRVSSILDWYKSDFGTTKEAIIAFVRTYRKGLPKNPKLSFLKYDWALNDR